MSADNTRVDTTFIGWLLIGFVLLLLGVIGLQWGDVFGEVHKDKPIDVAVSMYVSALVGFILILLMVLAYRTGNKSEALIFMFTGLFFIAMCCQFVKRSNSCWFLFIAFAVFLAIVAIHAFISNMPKFVTLALVLITLTVLFTGLGWGADTFGPWNNHDLLRAMCICSGIFAFLGFAVATYLGLAYSNPKKIPLV